MATAHGEFATMEKARAAIEALKEAGIPEARVRIWNVIPESPSSPERESHATRTGAVLGAVFGGTGGLAAGATAGAAIDAVHAAKGGEHHIPEPTGVRLVVDVPPSGPDVAAILRKCGAVNVE